MRPERYPYTKLQWVKITKGAYYFGGLAFSLSPKCDMYNIFIGEVKQK